MLFSLYTVYDKVAKESGPIFQAHNDQVAMRSFSQMPIDEKVKGDFELIKLGEYDTEKVQVTPCELVTFE